MSLGNNRDYKTTDRRVRKSLEAHRTRMAELISGGMDRDSASKLALEEIHLKRELDRGQRGAQQVDINASNDPVLALDACETQLRLTAEIIRSVFNDAQGRDSHRSWHDVADACERQAAFAKRAIEGVLRK